MSQHTAIEWTDATWPIVQGCDPYSQGCVSCYAIPLLWRMAHHPNPKISEPIQGLTEKHTNLAGDTVLRFTGNVALREDRLSWPLQWKTPKMIFVPSHGDIFHKDVPDSFIDKIFDVMERADWHTYQVLTKRSDRMRDYVNRRYADRNAPPHIWFMVSAEDQPNADIRIPDLLATKAAVRGVSLEPLLGPIDLTKIQAPRFVPEDHDIDWKFSALATGDYYEFRDDLGVWCTGDGPDRETQIDWAIVGGESGDGARPFHLEWADSIVDQCRAAGVPCFVKQIGAVPMSSGYPHPVAHRKGGAPEEWPERLRVREMPPVRA